jgi:hypothetical protein
MSRDEARADQLRRSLTVYRMAFGQSRQEDIVKYLLNKFQSDDVKTFANELCIDVAPDRSHDRRPVPLVSEEEVEAIELVEETASPAVHGVSLATLEKLLDDFAVVRPPTREGLTAAAIEDLLNAFRQVTARQFDGLVR